MAKMHQLLLATRPVEARCLEQMLRTYANGSDEFASLVARCAAKHNYAFRGVPEGLVTNLGIVTYDQLTAILLELQDHGSVRSQYADCGLANCIEGGLISALELGPRQPRSFLLQKKMIELHEPVLDNIICGRHFYLRKYADSIVPIVVVTASGDPAIGTGIFHCCSADDRDGWIITNRHVAVDDISRIESLGCFEQVPGVPILCHPTLDLCAIRVCSDGRAPGMFFGDELLLEEVVAVGFPAVAHSLRPEMLFHRGEINGYVSSYAEQGARLLVISCHVAPGNSGGPLLNNAGQVVGIVCQSKIGKSFAEADGVTSVHHVAIPAQAVVEFLSELRCEPPDIATAPDNAEAAH